MDKDKMVPQKLGINGLGRIAKLSIWHHVERRYFSELVINIGREVGTRIEDIAHFVEHDSTYGALHNYLYGARAKRVIEQLDEKSGSFVVNGVKATLLRQARNPAQIGWRSHGVDLVVDATGAFLDPTAPADIRKARPGPLRIRRQEGDRLGPFQDQGQCPRNADGRRHHRHGINDADYDPKKHLIVSNASCTTHVQAYKVKPLLDLRGGAHCPRR